VADAQCRIGWGQIWMFNEGQELQHAVATSQPVI